MHDVNREALSLFLRAALMGMARDVRMEPFLLAQMLGWQVCDFHHLWLDALANNTRTLLLAPRGHGKSTICAQVFALWKTLNRPGARILIVSSTQRAAELIIRRLAAVAAQHRGFQTLLGRARVRTRGSELVIRPRHARDDAIITAAGTNSSLTRRHFDVIIADDLVDQENSCCSTQRKKLRAWFDEMLTPCIANGGELHVTGTRYHDADLYGEILRRGRCRDGAFCIQVDKALQGGRPLWPGRFSVARLNRIRMQIGRARFECQYQNNPLPHTSRSTL